MKPILVKPTLVIISEEFLIDIDESNLIYAHDTNRGFIDGVAITPNKNILPPDYKPCLVIFASVELLPIQFGDLLFNIEATSEERHNGDFFKPVTEPISELDYNILYHKGWRKIIDMSPGKSRNDHFIKLFETHMEKYPDGNGEPFLYTKQESLPDIDSILDQMEPEALLGMLSLLMMLNDFGDPNKKPFKDQM